MAAAAIFAMPVSGLAQTAPPSQPPAPPSQPPASQAQPAPQQNPGGDAAKGHLTAARNTLSQLTQLPAASQLQGEPRTRVAQLINNFNEMITTKADWRASLTKVDADLDALLNEAPTPDEPPPTAAVGTSGSTTAGAVGTAQRLQGVTRSPAAIEADGVPQPSRQVRGGNERRGGEHSSRVIHDVFDHDDRHEYADDAADTASDASYQSQTPPTSQTPPASATPDAPPQNRATSESSEEMLRHIEAIEVILSAQAAAQTAAQSAAGGAVGTSGTASGSTRTTVTSSDVKLDANQIAQLRNHLAELRKLAEKK